MDNENQYMKELEMLHDEIEHTVNNFLINCDELEIEDVEQVLRWVLEDMIVDTDSVEQGQDDNMGNIGNIGRPGYTHADKENI